MGDRVPLRSQFLLVWGWAHHTSLQGLKVFQSTSDSFRFTVKKTRPTDYFHVLPSKQKKKVKSLSNTRMPVSLAHLLPAHEEEVHGGHVDGHVVAEVPQNLPDGRETTD
jgi:hypothetical protein